MYNKIDHDRTRRLGCTRRCDCSMAMHVAPSMLYLMTLWKYGCWWFFTFIFIFFLFKRSLFSLFVRYQHFQYLQGNEYVPRGILFEISLVAWVFKVWIWNYFNTFFFQAIFTPDQFQRNIHIPQTFQLFT